MTQRERDRLVVLKKAQKRLMPQSQAAAELRVSVRQVQRLVVKLKEVGDQAVVHGLRGRPSNRKLSEGAREKAVRILSQEVYQGFGPTLASEYLAKRHKLKIGRETLRQVMMKAGLWRARRQRIEAVHEWRPRRRARGELVQWDTSDHEWLEGRGPRLYLIHMLDDATSELTARFVDRRAITLPEMAANSDRLASSLGTRFGTSVRRNHLNTLLRPEMTTPARSVSVISHFLVGKTR